MRTDRLLLVAAACVAGCASTGVVPSGGDTFMIAKHGSAMSSSSPMMAELYVEANAFCKARNATVQTVSETASNGIPFVRTAGAELRFRCTPGA